MMAQPRGPVREEMSAPGMARDSEVIRVKRNQYIHLLDNNTNVTRTLVGPLVYTRKEHETSLFDPMPCVTVPAQCYCTVMNPCEREQDGSPRQDPSGFVHLRMGDSEIRLSGEPFPLYPGEFLQQKDGKSIFPLQVISAITALHVRCIRDFRLTEAGPVITAGTEWVESGPKTYIPHVEVEVLDVVNAQLIVPGSALRVRARRNFTDRSGTDRVAGERWLVRTLGAFLPSHEEEVEGIVEGVVLNEKMALHLSTDTDFVDIYGVSRKAGDKWMVTSRDAAVHIVDIHEHEEARVPLIVLSPKQYCVVLNPVDAQNKPQHGEKEMRRGEASFFLAPGESLAGDVRDVYVLSKDEALLLKALVSFQADGETHAAGATWMLHGPAEYIPSIEVEVLEKRQLIALDKNEGIYVMNTTTGDVRAVIGQPYMLSENEVLWEKTLPARVEELLTYPDGSLRTEQRGAPFTSTRAAHRVVRFNVQHNAAVQIYDYSTKSPRIVLGPNLVMLEPHEEFTVLSLSGGKPKVPNAIQSLQLFLGPRFSSDTIVVETSDHASLRLRLSYNWHFDVDRANASQKIFSVPDFIGDCCKTIASRVRGAVAAQDFDSFHRNSATIIRTAVFGVDENKELRKELRFSANNFVVTNIDVQSAEPTDEKTRDSLQKSVQLAIEITTKSQEAAARHGSELKDQQAKGQLERRKLLDKIDVEREKTRWLELQAKSEEIQASGQSVAEAKAKADALLIEANSELRQAELRAKAYQVSADSELKKLAQRQTIELEYTKRQNDMEVEKARRVATAEAEKVKIMVDAIGRDTLVAIARAGPELQAKLLEGLGLKGYLITDGHSPVNLFQTANGMIGNGTPQ